MVICINQIALLKVKQQKFQQNMHRNDKEQNMFDS